MDDCRCDYPHCRQTVPPGSGIVWLGRRLCTDCYNKVCVAPKWRAMRTLNIVGWEDEEVKAERRAWAAKLVRVPVLAPPPQMEA